MKKIFKQILLLFAAVIMFCNMTATDVKAATPYMKKINVSWDLKPRRQIQYKNRYVALGLRNETAKIVSYKKKSVGKKYKLTLKIRFECIKTIQDMTQEERDTFLEYDDGEGLLGNYNVVIADYKTGKSLYARNSYGVTAKCSYKTFREKYFYSSDYMYEDSFVDSYATVTITYPKSYRNLCIGIGGSNSYHGSTKADDRYYNGHGSYKKTSLYNKKDKGIMHFMRVK